MFDVNRGNYRCFYRVDVHWEIKMNVADFLEFQVKRMLPDPNQTVWTPDQRAIYLGDGVRALQSWRKDLNLKDDYTLYSPLSGTPDQYAEIPLAEILFPALAAYIAHRCFGDESSIGQNMEKSAANWQEYRQKGAS